MRRAVISGISFSVASGAMFFKLSGLIYVEPLSWNIAKVWYPSTLLFVGMLATSFWALRELGIATSNVLKNTTNILIVFAEYVLYSRVYSRLIWGTMLLMVFSAISTGVTDIAFSASGYTWQTLNNALTAANWIYLKIAMEKVKMCTVNGDKLDEYSLVFLNNLLSLPLILLLMAFNGEHDFYKQEALKSPMFILVATLSGVFAFGISFTVMWFLSTTTPATFSIVGCLNKVPISLLGLLFFDKDWSIANVSSVMLGLLAGLLFVLAKIK